MVVQDLQAIILAAGHGSRMTELVSSNPKCLLPIGNRPMIFYPLHSLEMAKFSEVLICVPEDHLEEISEAVIKLTSLKVIYFPVPKDQDLGTVDTLRLLDDQRKITKNLFLLSCDVITSFPLTSMINFFRVHDPTLTVFIGPSIPFEGFTPGRKGKQDFERDIIALDSKTENRLVFFQSELETDDILPVRLSMLKNCPNFDICNGYVDSHVYILKKWVLNYLKYSRKFKSIKSDLIPFLVEKQFKSTRKAKCADEDSNPKVDILDCSEVDEMINILENLDFLYLDDKDELKHKTEKNYPDSIIKCFAVIPEESIVIRANTIDGFFEANKRIKTIFSGLDFDLKKEIPPPSTPAPSFRPQIGSDCLICPTASFGEKVSVKKSSIGRDCIIGEKVKIANSLIMDGVKISENCNIQGSIICKNSSLGAGVELKDCIIIARHEVTGPGKFSKEILPSIATAYDI